VKERMIKREILKLIKKKETQSIEFTTIPSKEVGNSICAFANTNDGLVLVGVSDKGEIVGCKSSKKAEQQIANIAHSCKPAVYPKIEEVRISGKVVFAVKVKKTGSLHSYKNISYRRVGTHDKPMSSEELIEFARDTGKIRFDAQICEDALLRDMDKSKVRWFLLRAKAERGLEISPSISVREAMERLGLIRGDALTNAAVLLFAKNPQKFFLQSRIRCARFKGTDGLDYIDMKVVDGTIAELREKAMKFIMQHTKHAVFFDANRRYDRWEYPLRALEEVLSNALAHRDYYSNAEIQLSIYDDRIEVWNPGQLPKPLTPQVLKKKHRSIPRNRLLADKLFLIKYIEQWGKGTNRVVEWMREENLSEPEFRNATGGFEVTLIGPGRSFEEEIEKQKLHKLELNERQKRAVEYIKKKGSITNREYQELNRVSNKTAYKDLSELLRKEILVFKPKGKYSCYEFR
jgi:ATP-dependent DNA helicase RecG